MNTITHSLIPLFFVLVSTAAWSQHEHKHEQSASDSGADVASATPATGRLTITPEIEIALANGGNAVVAEVLGVVCDFCAVAMNKIFGRQEEVAAVYVDLDTKALNLVFKPGASLDDDAIAALAVQAGYRIAAVHRSDAILGS